MIESCNQTTSVSVLPKNFKIKTPFLIDGKGIIINTYWGKEKKHYVLCLDNNSPSWIKSSRIQYNQSFKKSNDIFKTTTADGAMIQGNVGICDSLYFENIAFTNVSFYVMQNNVKNDNNDDGVLGIEVMTEGIWKIDFKQNTLALASSIDSFKEVNQCEVFPAVFNPYSINVQVGFGTSNVKTIPIDLGYNGDVIMPLNEFKSIGRSRQTFINAGKFNTPGQQNFVNTESFFDTVTIGHNYFITLISSNEKVKERSIGLTFFKRFDYVIFDFINKRIYIPEKVW